ncbi:hypothetical protein GCK32_017099 [Trichostrongylus colubriformis]|uniref:Uncharacterized protein n=1 Tax=Trichostrongylus colubriformis TaxID=6319 RepID=A0AAN8FCT6_TRICO
MCTHDAAVLHMKKTARFGNRWVAHILTLRTDMIIPLTYEHKAIDDKHLALIMEAVAFAWRPTLYVHGGQPYKAFRFDTFIKKVVKERIYLMPTIAVLMVFCVAVVCAGTYCARRSKENAERRAIQNQRAELLSDWGQPPDSQVSDIIEQDWSRRTSITSGELAVSSNQGFDGNERSKDVVRSTGQDTRKSLREALDMM